MANSPDQSRRCIEPGCFNERYQPGRYRYTRCKAHQQAFWRGVSEIARERASTRSALRALPYAPPPETVLVIADYRRERVYCVSKVAKMPATHRELQTGLQRLRDAGFDVMEFPE